MITFLAALATKLDPKHGLRQLYGENMQMTVSPNDLSREKNHAFFAKHGIDYDSIHMIDIIRQEQEKLVVLLVGKSRWERPGITHRWWFSYLMAYIVVITTLCAFAYVMHASFAVAIILAIAMTSFSIWLEHGKK